MPMMGMTSRSRVEDQLARYARYFRKETAGRDLSLEAAEAIAQAYNAVVALEAQGADLSLRSRMLIAPALVRAYRELLYVRKHLPPELVQEDVPRRVRLTRLGQIQPQTQAPKERTNRPQD